MYNQYFFGQISIQYFRSQFQYKILFLEALLDVLFLIVIVWRKITLIAKEHLASILLSDIRV